MTRDVQSGSETKTINTVVRVAALVAWMGVGIFISRVLGDLMQLSEQRMPCNPAILTFSMFALSTIAMAAYWFAKSFDRTLGLPRVGMLEKRLIESARDDASVKVLHNEATS